MSTNSNQTANLDIPEMRTLGSRLKFYITPFDKRYEDLKRGNWLLNVASDFTAGLIVAMVAIPLAMGLAIASGLPPEMGIVGGAVAGLIGALVGGSKYQVYGPTAAFIPVILAITSRYEGYNFLIWCSVFSGIILMVMGLARLGRMVAMVPNSIVVGFTIGIAVVIAISQIEYVFGIKSKLEYGLIEKVKGIVQYAGETNPYTIMIALLTFFVTKWILKLSKYAPAPLIAVGISTLIAGTVWSGKDMSLIKDKYGEIPDNLLRLTLPGMIELTPSVLIDLVYYVIAIVFVSGVESLLCSRMADRLAGNQGTPYNPDKELWGQGWVQVIVVLLNGFPHTGALARTATNIKVGAISPLAGIFKFALKLMLAFFLADWLEIVPMACIGGILMFVAFNMVKPAEVAEVWRQNRFHVFLMVYTAVMVPLTDFLIGVLSALVIYGATYRFLDRPIVAGAAEVEPAQFAFAEADEAREFVDTSAEGR